MPTSGEDEAHSPHWHLAMMLTLSAPRLVMMIADRVGTYQGLGNRRRLLDTVVAPSAL